MAVRLAADVNSWVILFFCCSLFLSYALALNTEGDKDNVLPQGLGKPPPLLPTPPGPSSLQSVSLLGGPMGTPSPPVPLLPTPGQDISINC